MKQIVVTCDNCHKIIAMGDEMEEEEANKLKSKLVINPFGAPRCSECKKEPYSDINLMHTITVMDYESNRNMGDVITNPEGK